MSQPTQEKAVNMPTFREIMRIGVNERGEDIFASKKDKEKVLAHEKAAREAKRKKKSGSAVDAVSKAIKDI